MPISAPRALRTMPLSVVDGVLPRARFFKSRTGIAADSIIASPRLLALFGTRFANRIIGATVLHSVLRPNISSVTTKSSVAAPKFDLMMEPYGAVIKSLQTDFLKIGFSRVHEDSYSVTFSDGNGKVELGLTERNYHPSLVVLYTNRHGAYHRLTSLQEKLNSPETGKRESAAWFAIMEKYGLWRDDGSASSKANGHRACLYLGLKQTIAFLEKHKTTLAAIKPDEESVQYANVFPKASEKLERERCMYQRLWKSRHDRFVGAPLLNSVSRRGFHSVAPCPAALARPMMAPFGEVIRSLQPEFLNLGYTKIEEDERSITFSDGTRKIQFAVTDRHYHPVLTGYLIKPNGACFSLASLRDKLTGPKIKKSEFEARMAINEKYGLWNSATPKSMRDIGYRACLALNLSQTLTFLDAHKQTLSELKSDDDYD